jgi:alanyl-tRNA synthetase
MQVGAGTDAWSVRLAGPGGPDLEVTVRYDRTGGGTQWLTCDADQARPVPLFRLVTLRSL